MQVYRAEELGLDYRSDPHKDMYEWRPDSPSLCEISVSVPYQLVRERFT
jgi:hypothetical protein